MKTFIFLFQALVFGGALLCGITAVYTYHFVAANLSNAISASVKSEELVSVEKLSTLSVFDETSTISFEDTYVDHDPSGYYSLDPEKVPKEFADIEFLAITTHEFIEKNGVYTNTPIVPRAYFKQQMNWI